MKTILLIILYNIINLISINAEQCYVCDQAPCDRPGSTDVKVCSDANDGGTSGKSFVAAALKKSNASSAYTDIQNDYSNYAQTTLGLNQSIVPAWNSLTEWVCYKTVDKRRGCLVMTKGFCQDGKNILKPLSDIGEKITAVLAKATNSITKIFTGSNTGLTDDQKGKISTWFAENYFSKLVNGSTDAQYQLEYCCQGDKCNFASMIKISTAVLILSCLILV